MTDTPGISEMNVPEHIFIDGCLKGALPCGAKINLETTQHHIGQLF